MDQETNDVSDEKLSMSTIQKDHVSNEEVDETQASGTETSFAGSVEPKNLVKVDFLGGENFHCGDYTRNEAEKNESVSSATIPIIVIEEPEADQESHSDQHDCALLRKDNSGLEEFPKVSDLGDKNSSSYNTEETKNHNTQDNITVSPTVEIVSASEESPGVQRGYSLEDISPETHPMKNVLVEIEEEVDEKDENRSTDNTVVEVSNHLDCSGNLKTDECREKEVELIKEVSENQVCGSQEVDENEHKNEAEDEKQTDEVGSGEPQKNRSRTYPFKVFVSGLPQNARLDDITSYFSQFGEVLKTFDEGRHKANIIFSDAESVKKAVFCHDPFFDDHKLLIRSVNEITTVINGIPQCMLMRDAEKAIKKCMEEANVPVCRVSIPMNDSSDLDHLQGHAFVVFCDQQTLQIAEEKQKQEPFIVADTPVVLFPSINHFYKQFCVRVYPLPSDPPRSVVYHNVHTAMSECGQIISQVCVYVSSSSSYAVYVLFAKEEAVKSALEMTDVKIFDQYVEVSEFHSFESGQGFRHLWLKVLNIPRRITITELKHHFGHDKGIIYIELDTEFSSCFFHVDSEHTIQRCLKMHQTYLRGKCISVMIADEHPGRNNYFRGGRQNDRYRSNYNRNMKKHTGGGRGGYNGMMYASGQNVGTQERRGYDWKERKFSKLRNSKSEGSQQSQNSASTNGGEAKAVDNTAA